MKHSASKIKLANAPIEFKDSHCPQKLSFGSPDEKVAGKVHVLVLLEKPNKRKDGKERKFQRSRSIVFIVNITWTRPHQNRRPVDTVRPVCGQTVKYTYPLCAPSTGGKG